MKASKFTAIDFFDDLTSPYARNRFFVAFLFAIVICGVGLWAVETYCVPAIAKQILSSVLTEIVSAAVLTLLFYALYVFLIGPNETAREVSVTRPQDISGRMLAMPLDVRRYSLWGRSGSFFRAYPLIKLDEQAKEKKRVVKVDVLLPDPNDERLISSYRDILNALNELPGENPLLPNVLATCMACAILASNNKHLDIRIHLSRFLPAFRVDISDNGAIVTQDDPKKSALFFEYGSEFYDMFESMIANERTVSREITWDKTLFMGLKLEEKSCDAKTLGAFDIAVHGVDKLQ